MNSLKSLEEKYTSACELLKNKIKDEPKPLNPSLLKEEKKQLIDQRIISLKKEMDNLRDKIDFKIHGEFDEKEETKKEISAEKDLSEEFDFNNKNEFNSLDSHISSTDLKENSIKNMETILLCSEHKDRKAEWICQGHCNKKFCWNCFNKIGFCSVHGELLKINKKLENQKNQANDKLIILC